jgi:hypothetical protein
MKLKMSGVAWVDLTRFRTRNKERYLTRGDNKSNGCNIHEAGRSNPKKRVSDDRFSLQQWKPKAQVQPQDNPLPLAQACPCSSRPEVPKKKGKKKKTYQAKIDKASERERKMAQVVSFKDSKILAEVKFCTTKKKLCITGLPLLQLVSYLHGIFSFHFDSHWLCPWGKNIYSLISVHFYIFAFTTDCIDERGFSLGPS